jgi:Na+/melibiose symporter-like transporter
MSLEGKLGLGTRASWTFTALPENIKNGAWDAFVLFYYAQVLGLDGSLIALALGLILIIDALVDPYVGTLSDSLRNAPLGRRHTLMLMATVPFGIGFSGVFSPPEGLTQWGLFAWLLGFGVVARVGISFYTVPAFAVGVELTRDPKERSLVMALRNIGASAGMLLVPVIAFRLFFTPTEQYPRGQLNPEPYSGFGLALTAIALVAMLIAAFGTRARIREVEALEAGRAPDAEQPGSSLRNLARELATAMRVTPNVRRVLAVSFLVFIINSTITTLTLYLATYFWRLGSAQTEQLLVAGTVGSFCGLVTAWWLVARLEKKTLMVASILAYFGCGLLSIGLPLLGLADGGGAAAGRRRVLRLVPRRRGHRHVRRQRRARGEHPPPAAGAGDVLRLPRAPGRECGGRRAGRHLPRPDRIPARHPGRADAGRQGECARAVRLRDHRDRRRAAGDRDPRLRRLDGEAAPDQRAACRAALRPARLKSATAGSACRWPRRSHRRRPVRSAACLAHRYRPSCRRSARCGRRSPAPRRFAAPGRCRSCPAPSGRPRR